MFEKNEEWYKNRKVHGMVNFWSENASWDYSQNSRISSSQVFFVSIHLPTVYLLCVLELNELGNSHKFFPVPAPLWLELFSATLHFCPLLYPGSSSFLFELYIFYIFLFYFLRIRIAALSSSHAIAPMFYYYKISSTKQSNPLFFYFSPIDIVKTGKIQSDSLLEYYTNGLNSCPSSSRALVALWNLLNTHCLHFSILVFFFPTNGLSSCT